MVKVADVNRMKKLESILLICVFVATTMMVILPLTAPEAQAVIHLATALDEDLFGPPYDMDGVQGNGHVLWSDAEDHIIGDPLGYTIEAGMTLEIPNLNWQFDNPSENVVEFQGNGKRMDVYGTLITQPGPAIKQYTCFTGTGLIGEGWDGIYFYAGSSGNLRDVRINNSQNGVVMGPGSSLLSPGVQGSRFENIKNFGMQMDGVTGTTNIDGTNFYNGGSVHSPNASGIGLSIANGELNIGPSTAFYSHGSNLSSLYIMDATVNVDGSEFYGNNQPGYSVLVEGSASVGTVLNNCTFSNGLVDNHYIRSDGASILIDNNTFDTSGGQRSVIANDFMTDIADVLLRNPNPPGTTFDNTTINATGGSSVTLQWYKDIYVEDPDGNLISNSPVRIKDRLDNLAQPSVQQTDVTGWARWIICTEFTKYAASISNFNPFNISAENNSMYGYAYPEETMDMSKVNTIIVPFNPGANTPPVVSYIETPVGIQSGYVSIQYILSDPDPYDDGSLSCEVYFTTDNITWYPATIAPVSDPITNLNNNTMYTFVWDSAAINDLPGIYNETVQIKIIPSDKQGSGTPGITGTFIVDNAPPPPPSPPMNITAMLSPEAPENVEIIWNASPDDGSGDFDVVGYTVYKSLSGVNGSYNFEAWIPANSSLSYNWIDLGAGDGDWKNYFYLVRANDTLNNEEQNTDKVGKFVNYLELDWNLFSVPLIQSNTSQEHVLQTINGNYEILQGYHAGKSRPWLNHNKKKPPWLNHVIEINIKEGYYIKMINPDHLVVAGTVPVNTQISIKTGWNLVGYPCLINKTVADALSSISGKYNKVEFFNTTTGKEEGLGPTDLMYPGFGYWIHATSDCVWEVPL